MAIARFFAPDSGLPKGLIGQLIGKTKKGGGTTKEKILSHLSPLILLNGLLFCCQCGYIC